MNELPVIEAPERAEVFDLSSHIGRLPPEQQAIQDRCLHPSGTFIEFQKSAVEQSIPDRFEEQVRRWPDRLAVKTKNHQLTYDELNKAANRVAHRILAHHNHGHEPVAMLFTQGIPGVATILGVLKSGRSYIPLDPLTPSARLKDMLLDSQSILIVTNGQNLGLAKELAQDHGALLNVDQFDSNLSTDNPGLSLSPESPAFIMYTSGSTGQPKGILQNHRNMLHSVMNHTNGLHVCPEDRLSLLYSHSGVSGLKDTLSALLNGASLHPWNLQEDGVGGLPDWLIGEEITIYRSSATIFRSLITTLTGGEGFPKIRLVYLGDEPVHKRDVDLYKQHFSSDCIFVNGLGSTETNTFSIYCVDGNTQISGPSVPVGHLTEDLEVVLLDEDGKEVGMSQVGEIAVRSHYLSPGYWRRPDLTQAAFLPGSDGGDQRMYLTGDLGRMLPDGCLEHMGRKDFQVKIRGYRVEVAEVEMALLDRTDVKESVVVAREDRPGNPRLVAYVVPAGHPAPTISSLRSSLQETLPEYMVPSAFVFLDALPTLQNGKVDRRGMPSPGSSRPELGTALVGARTPVEQRLLGVWTEVLGLDEVGVHDNFLELGGDSLLAGQIVSRVISEFRVELPLRSLFQAPTVADMALAITQRRAKAANQTDIDRMLSELETLSAEKAKQFLDQDSGTREGSP